jgi:hypothetical protein
VFLRDGRRESRRLSDLVPLAPDGVRRRARDALSRLLGEARAQRIEREVEAIVDCPDAARIARLLARG